MKNKSYFSLMLWIVVLITMGMLIGSLTTLQINTWYRVLNRSVLTPPDYIFPIAWSILYTLIGACGWIIWKMSFFPSLPRIKFLYLIQLILNWCWTPLFFHYHFIGLSLLVLVIMDILVSIIIYLTYWKIRMVSILMIPYLLWILFASYLNFYMWLHN